MIGRVVELEAAPHRVELDIGSAAALVVDMQNDFGAKGGMFDRAGIDVSVIRRAIEPTAEALDSIRRAGIPVIYLKMGYRPDLSDLGPPGSPNRDRHLAFSVGDEIRDPSGRRSRILIRDTWNTAILDELEPQPVKWLIVVGCTTSVCVESTIRDAMFRDYSCVLLTDCTAEPIGSDGPRTNQEASQAAIEALFGWTSTSADLVHSLKTVQQ